MRLMRQKVQKLVDTKEEIYGECDFVAKVKEFEPSEYGLLREKSDCVYLYSSGSPF